jgi:glycine/D-amino acid oxidase-like deaminating enzyme
VKQAPFWVEEHPRPEGITAELPAEADVLIVGSGLTGLTAALRLARGGKSVAVIDSGEIAAGASSVNGGMVSPDIKAGIKLIFDQHGPDLGREMWQATVRSVDIVSDLAHDEDIDVLIMRGGMAALGIGTDAQVRFEQSVSWYREHVAVDWEVLGPARIGEVIGGGPFTTAIFEPEGFGIQPARFVFGLAERVAGAGASLVPHCEAISFDRVGNAFRVVTTSGPVRAGEVVLATNGYTTARPSAELSRRIVPVGSYIIVTEPIEDLANELFPGGAMTYTKKRLLNYMRRTPDGRVLIGGRRNLHPGLDLEESAAALRAQLVGYFPQLADVPLTHVWGGKLAVPFDLVPHMGQIDGAWYALGYAGHGVGLSTLMGHELGGMLLGEEPPSVFTRVPHPTRFYYRGSPWFLTPASILYRALDRLGR